MTDKVDSGAAAPQANEALDDPVAHEADLYEAIPAEEAQLVPDGEPAHVVPVGARKRLAPGRIATIVALVVVLIAIAAYGAVRADAVWGRHAMVATGVMGIEALVQGRGDLLAALSNKAVEAQLTTPVVSAMRAKGILADFGTPVWAGESAVVTATTGMGPGAFEAIPSPDGAAVVIYRTAGTLSKSTGALSFERTWSGWKISGLTVQATPTGSSTPTPSAVPTATP